MTTVAPGNALNEERRWVSVLFVDIAGYTVLAARLDPEDVRALQQEYFRRVHRVVRRWGGIVEKYIGDAVLAVFGAPRSDEHDAYRAVLAGMEIQAVLAGLTLADGSPVRVRVGIATGEAVVDLAAARDGGQALVCGDVVNVAARLQAHAEADTVVVTAATRRATAPLVRYQGLPALVLAGRPAPVATWRALGVEPRPAARCGAPVTGREAELATVAGQLTRALRGHTPALVPVVGPAGSGKSRLVRELAARGLGASAGEPQWWVGRCPPGPAGPYAPIADLVQAQAGVRTTDDAGAVRRKLARWAGALVTAAELPPVLDALVGLVTPPPGPGDPPGPARGTTADGATEQALLHLLRSAARQPLVLVIEDLHLADTATTRLVRRLPAAASRLPLAVVATHRPDPRLDGSLGAAVALGPLSTQETRRLLCHLLAGAGQATGLADRLLPLVGGNPGYAEEYVRTLAEQYPPDGQPVDGNLPVPPRVRGIVSARLGGVEQPDRTVLQAAAVLRDAVWPEAVAALLDMGVAQAGAALSRLERLGLLVQRQPEAVPGRPRYEFAEAVVQQVVYVQLPRAARGWLHRRAAERLPADLVRRCHDVDVQRAGHWLAASALAPVLHQDGQPYLVAACTALALAAHRAMRRGTTGRAWELAARTQRLWPTGASASRTHPLLAGVLTPAPAGGPASTRAPSTRRPAVRGRHRGHHPGRARAPAPRRCRSP